MKGKFSTIWSVLLSPILGSKMGMKWAKLNHFQKGYKYSQNFKEFPYYIIVPTMMFQTNTASKRNATNTSYCSIFKEKVTWTFYFIPHVGLQMTLFLEMQSIAKLMRDQFSSIWSE